MNTYLVKDLMVPLSEYATVRKGSTLFDAVIELEKVQKEYDHSKYLHRAVLIMDQDDQIIGKLSQLDVLRALRPKDEKIDQLEDISRFGFSSSFIANQRQQHRSQGSTLVKNCANASMLKVEDFMQAVSQGECVEEDTDLDTAIYLLTREFHLSLLVTRGKKIVGILKMSDVFGAVFHIMKAFERKE